MGGDKIMKIMSEYDHNMIFELFGNGNDVDQAGGGVINSWCGTVISLFKL